MLAQNDQQERSMIQDWRLVLRFIHTVASYGCVPLAVVMSKGGKIGERYVGFPALVGLVMQLVIVALAGGPTGDLQVLAMCGLTLIGLLAHRLHWHRVRRNGFRCHSLYTGEWAFPGHEWAVKGVVVPAIALFVGIAVCGFAPGAGLWLIFASISQAIVTEVSRQQLRAEAQAQIDARFDQQAVARQREEMR